MKIPPSFKVRACGMASAVALFLAGSPAQGQIHADFAGGNGSDLVDQYFGVAGDGWTSAWSARTNGTNGFISFDGSVGDANPLNGGGNYLSSTLVAGSTASKGSVSRGYGDYEGLSLSAPYTVKFSMRLDSDLSMLSQPTDYLQAFDLPGGDSDFGGSGTWLIRAFGATTGTSNQNPAHTWMFYNGTKNGAGYNVNNFVSSGVSLISGEVYDFVVDMDPTTLSYRVSINGGEFSEWLGYRRGTVPTSSNLNFGTQLAGDDKTLTFSVDSIEIVPEPSVAALVLFAGAAGGVPFLRRRARA